MDKKEKSDLIMSSLNQLFSGNGLLLTLSKRVEGSCYLIACVRQIGYSAIIDFHEKNICCCIFPGETKSFNINGSYLELWFPL